VLVVADAEKGVFGVEDEEQLALFGLQASNAVGNASVHAKLKDVERLKSDFVAMVSHEIRTPITAIQGILGLLRDDAPDEREELLEIAEINARRLLSIVTDILDFSKLEASKLPMSFASTDVGDVIDAVVRSMKRLASELGIRLRTNVSEELPHVLADRLRVEQVLTNLISNAVKFSSAGDVVSIGAEREGEAVRIAVEDRGCGIDAKDIPRLFTKLTQLDMGNARSVGGTGLGLVISRAIVEAHGGEIFVSSQKGQGSVFEFLLPIEPPPAGRSREPRARSAKS
jgi:signal transduction histidine kinase